MDVWSMIHYKGTDSQVIILNCNDEVRVLFCFVLFCFLPLEKMQLSKTRRNIAYENGRSDGTLAQAGTKTLF